MPDSRILTTFSQAGFPNLIVHSVKAAHTGFVVYDRAEMRALTNNQLDDVEIKRAEFIKKIEKKIS